MANQDQNGLGGMMAAQNELASLNAARAQNSQAEQAFLQQQQAANAVMMQAAQIGASDGVSQQVGAMNPQTQALLAQYGITGAPPRPGQTSSSSKTTQSGGNIKIENTTTTNNDIKIINPPSSGSDGGNQAKFQTWLSNSFAKQNQDYEVQKRLFARRDRDLEKQSNKMMRELEKTTSSLGEKLNPQTWAAANADQTKKVLGIMLLTIAPTLIKPIAEGIENLKNFFTGGTDGGSFFSRFKTAIGLDDEKTSLPEAIGKTVSDGIQGVKDWFGLLFEERKRAIESVEKPKRHLNGDKDARVLWRLGDWMVYLSNVVSAGLGGFNGLSKATADQMRDDSQKKFTTSKENAATMESGVHSLMSEDTWQQRTISNDYYSLTGRLKGGNSLGAMAVTRGISAEININGLGVDKDASIIGKRMSDLETLVNKEGSYLIGEKQDVLNFLDVWGLDEKYLGLLLKEKLIYPKNLLYITYKVGKNKIDAGLFEKDKPLPDTLDQKNIIDVVEKVFYIMTKEGFDRIKKDVFGDEKFEFNDSKNDSQVYNKLTSIHSDQTFANSEKFQQLTDTNSMSAAYQEERANVSFGQAGEVAKVISNQAQLAGGRVKGFVSSAWKSIKGATLKGAYLNTDAGRQNFIEDLYGVFSKELFSFYKSKGLSDEEAQERASSMASILTSQCALESGYGTNSNSKYYNYANLTGGKKTRKGKDKDKNGDEIEQNFRVFESGEEFAQALIHLLDNGKQYEGALFADSAEDYFKMIQRGYDGVYDPHKFGADNGKFAEDKEYVSKGLGIAEKVIPTIEEYAKSLVGEENSSDTGSSIKFDGSTPHYITPDKQYKAEFDRLRVGNLKEGETPWDTVTGLYQYNRETGKYDIPVDRNMFNLSDPNSIKEIINRGVSSNQYPEIHSLMFDNIGPKDGILFYRQPRKNFSNLAQAKIAETANLLGKSDNHEDYTNIPFYLIPTKDGKQFQINTISVRTMNYSESVGPKYTGFVYEQPSGRFPDEYYKIPEATISGLPSGRNPLFYSIGFELDSEGLEALQGWRSILSSGFYINKKGALVYKNVNGNEVYLTEKHVSGLEQLGLITDVSKRNLGLNYHGYSAKLTESGENFKNILSNDERSGWHDNHYKYLTGADWSNMSDDEKSKYIDYLSTLTSDPQKKVQLELLKGTADLALEQAQRIVGVITPSSVKPPTPTRVTTTTSTNKGSGEQGSTSFSNNVGNDYRTYTDQNTTYNIFSSPWTEQPISSAND